MTRAEGQIGRHVGHTDGREEISWRVFISIRLVSHRLVRKIPNIVLELSSRPSKRPSPRYHPPPPADLFPHRYDPAPLKGHPLRFSICVWSMGPDRCGRVQTWLGMGAFRGSVFSSRYPHKHRGDVTTETFELFAPRFVESELPGPGPLSNWFHAGCFLSRSW